MLRRSLYSLVGILLIAAALAGLVISVAGIFGVWRVRQSMNEGLSNTLSVLQTTLDATDEGLEIAGQSLDQAASSLESLTDVIQTTGKTVRDSVPMVNTLARVTTDDIPSAIERTQAALQSAQSSARFIDTTLRLITSIPFLPIERYNPEMSLDDALGEASTSLDPISDSLLLMEEPLANSTENLTSVAEQLDAMAVNIGEIRDSLAKARGVIQQYLEVISALKRRLVIAQVGLPYQLSAVAWVITIVLVWLALTQVGLMIQGLGMLGLSFAKPHGPPGKSQTGMA